MAYRSIYQDAIDSISGFLDAEEAYPPFPLIRWPTGSLDRWSGPDAQNFLSGLRSPEMQARDRAADTAPAIDTVVVRSPASQVERISDSNPRTSAGRELARTYWEMQDKNVPTTDQFFHCMGACRAVKKSNDKPRVLSMTRHKEYTDRARNLFGLYGAARMSPADMQADMAEDMTANTWGATCPENDTCNDRCAPFLDNLAPKYRPFMKTYRTTW